MGKSSVVLRFCQNDFQANKEPTIGVYTVFLSLFDFSAHLVPLVSTGAAFLTQRCRLGASPVSLSRWRSRCLGLTEQEERN